MAEAQKEKKPTFVFNSSFRTNWVNIVKARAFKGKEGSEKFGARFIMEPDAEDFKRLKAEITTLLQTKNPGKKLVPRRLTQEELEVGNVIEVHVPWNSGDAENKKFLAASKPEVEAYKGKIVLKTSSKYQPAMGVIQKGAVVDLVTEEARAAAGKFFYSGAFLIPREVGLNYYPASSDGKPAGVSLYLNVVIFHKDGEKIGGGGQRSAAEAFKGYLGKISEEDPTAGAVDELSDLN